MPGIVFVTCASMPLLSGAKSIQAQIPGANQIGSVLDLAATTGNNTVSLPVGAVAALIVPPATNVATLSYGLTTGTQSAISRILPTLVTFDATAPPASFVVNVGANTALEITFW